MQMKKQVTGAMIAMLGVIALESNPAAQEKFQKLSGAQIQARFPGMELTDEAHWGEVFERNGTLTITSMGHKSVGKWRIQKDQLCLETGGEPAKACSGQVIATMASMSARKEFYEERVARPVPCTSCLDDVGHNCSDGREVPKAYGWANPRQARRHGADG